MTLSLAPLPPCPSSVDRVSRLTYFNIRRGAPPGRRPNQPTWHLASARRPSLPRTNDKVAVSHSMSSSVIEEVTNRLQKMLDDIYAPRLAKQLATFRYRYVTDVCVVVGETKQTAAQQQHAGARIAKAQLKADSHCVCDNDGE